MELRVMLGFKVVGVKGGGVVMFDRSICYLLKD